MSLYDRASIIPGRSNTRSKAPDRFVNLWADEPRYRATLLDVDGVERIDMLAALGARSLGYERVPPPAYGVGSLPHRFEVEAAEAVLEHVAPWASSARFFKTGSEATHAAYRIAKNATGRSQIFMGDWAYHGWHEWTELDTLKFAHGSSLEDDIWIEDRVAAVFIEPHRWEPVDVNWLRSVREFCDQVGALLVFDSMIYGGRWALGGASQYFGVYPDLECFGKAYGNGQAVAFVVGNRALADHGEVASGTHSGDATGLSALIETVKVYTSEPVISTLWQRGRKLQSGLREVIPPEIGVVEGEPVHQRIRFHEASAAPAGAYDYRTTERPLAMRFRHGMAERGVICLPDAINVMYSHTTQQIERVIEAARETVRCL